MSASTGLRALLAVALLMAGAALAATPENLPPLRLSEQLARPPQPAMPLRTAGTAAASGEDFARLLAEPQRCPATAGRSNQPLTINVVLAAVVCHHRLVRQGTGLQMQAEAALDRAEAQRQPGLNFSTGADASSRSSNAWSAVLRLDWVLYDFGSRDAGLRQARSALVATLASQRAEVLVAIGEAAQLFAEGQASLGRSQAASFNLRSAEDSARMAEARHNGGAATLAEKLQAQTALAQARLEAARGRSQWLSARGALALAMGLRVSEALEIAAAERSDTADDEVAFNMGSLIEEARSHHPRIAAAQSRLAEAKALAAGAKADRWGRVGLNAQTGRSRASSDDGIALSTTATLGWTLPLFDRRLNASRLRDAEGQIQQSSVSVDDALRQVELQVWQQGQALLGARTAERESRLVLESAETALQVIAGRYRQGVGSFSEVLVAQSVTANARFQRVEAAAGLHRAELLLAAAVGRFGL